MLNKAISASFACLAFLSACSRQLVVAAPVPDETATVRARFGDRVEESPLRGWFRSDDGALHAILPSEADGAPFRVEAVAADGCVLAAGASGGGPDVQLERVERCAEVPQLPPPDLGAAPDMAPEPPDLLAPELPDLAGPPPDLAPRRVELAPSGLHRVATPSPGRYVITPGYDFVTRKADPAMITFPLPVSDARQEFSLEISGATTWAAPSPTIYCDASEGQYTLRSADNKLGYCPSAYWEARVVPAAWGPGEGGAIVGGAWDCAGRDDRGVCKSARWPELRGTPQGYRVSVPAGKQYEVRVFVQGAVEITGLTVAVSAR